MGKHKQVNLVAKVDSAAGLKAKTRLAQAKALSSAVRAEHTVNHPGLNSSFECSEEESPELRLESGSLGVQKQAEGPIIMEKQGTQSIIGPNKEEAFLLIREEVAFHVLNLKNGYWKYKSLHVVKMVNILVAQNRALDEYFFFFFFKSLFGSDFCFEYFRAFLYSSQD